MIECPICHKSVADRGLATHLKTKHQVDPQTYYDEKFKKEGEGICPICGKKTTFRGFLKGYSRYCSVRCSRKDPKVQELRQKTSLERYGYTHPNKNPKIKKKIHDTTVERWGAVGFASKELNDRVKETKKERYGDSNYHNVDKMMQTNLERYGTTCTLNSDDVIERKHQTWLENYGVDNPSKSDLIKDKKVKTRTTKTSQFESDNDCTLVSTLIDRYQTTGWFQAGIVDLISYNNGKYVRNSDIPKIEKYVAESFKNFSHGEKEVADFVKTLDPDIIENTKKIIAPLELNMYSEKYRVAIEYNGVYWHSQKPKDYHLMKTKQCIENHIHLIQITDIEWLTHRDICKSIIRSAFGVYSTKIYARQCDVREVDSKTASDFLITNHIQGEVNSKYRIGLYYKDELVELMCFGKSRFNRSETELLRFCTKLDYQVIGGFSKLLKHQPYDTIVSYVDRAKFNGEGYLKVGFTLVSETPPSYFYWRDDVGKVSRFRAQKHRLPTLLGNNFNPNQTELENMLNNGFLQYYDCGNLKMVWCR